MKLVGVRITKNVYSIMPIYAGFLFVTRTCVQLWCWFLFASGVLQIFIRCGSCPMILFHILNICKLFYSLIDCLQSEANNSSFKLIVALWNTVLGKKKNVVLSIFLVLVHFNSPHWFVLLVLHGMTLDNYMKSSLVGCGFHLLWSRWGHWIGSIYNLSLTCEFRKSYSDQCFRLFKCVNRLFRKIMHLFWFQQFII